MGACSCPVRSEPVQNQFRKFMAPPNLELDHRSGFSPGMNLGPVHGPVQLGSGSNHGSELNLTIPMPMAVTPPYDALIAHDVDLYDVDLYDVGHYMSVVYSLESLDRIYIGPLS